MNREVNCGEFYICQVFVSAGLMKLFISHDKDQCGLVNCTQVVKQLAETDTL